MKILIAGLVNNIQLKRLEEEGNIRNHQVDGCYGKELIIKASKGIFEPAIRGKNLKDYDLIYLMVTKSRWEWYIISRYLHLNQGTMIVNRRIFDSGYNFFLSPGQDYEYQVKEKLPFPKSSVVLSSKSVDDVLMDYSFPLILKLSNSQQGRGVYLLKNKEELVEKIKTSKEKANDLRH